MLFPYITHQIGTRNSCVAPKGMVFSLKTGIDFAHYGLESGTVFEGNKGVYAV